MDGPHEGHTKATGKTCSFSACARQRVKNCLPSSKRLLWQLWFLKKHMFYQWPSCGLRVAFVGFPSGLRVAFVWQLTKAVNFKGPKCQEPSQGPRYPACCHRYHACRHCYHDMHSTHTTVRQWACMRAQHLRQCARVRVQPWDAGFFQQNAQPFCSKGFVCCPTVNEQNPAPPFELPPATPIFNIDRN